MDPFSNDVTVHVKTWGIRQVIPHKEPEYLTQHTAEFYCGQEAGRRRCIHDPTSIQLKRHRLQWCEVPDWALSREYRHFNRAALPAGDALSDYDALHTTVRVVEVPEEVWRTLTSATARTVQKLMPGRSAIRFTLPVVPITLRW